MPDEKLASRWLVSTDWLRQHLTDPNVVVLDGSYYLANAKRDAPRAAHWRRWQSDADAVWKDHPYLSRQSVARLVKKRLQLSEQSDSIARRIRK